LVVAGDAGRQDGTVAGLRIAQKKESSGAVIEQTEIGYDAANNQLYVDRSQSGNRGIRPDKIRQTINLRGAQVKSNWRLYWISRPWKSL